MYQFIVLGLGFLLLFGGAFLLKKEDKGGVLEYAFSKDVRVLNTVLPEEMIIGVYTCDIKNGCANPYTLTLAPDNNVEVSISYDDGADTKKENGTWKLEKGNIITISLTDSSSGESYDPPRGILIQTVSTSTLSKFSYNTKLYPDMRKPVFTKQTNGE